MAAHRPSDGRPANAAVDPRGGGPRVGAIVLAAGGSSRMGGRNKLLQHVGGEAVIARVVNVALAAGADPVVVVTGHQEREVRDALAGARVELVSNPQWAKGMSRSLAAGVAALEGRVEGALICLGDMPRVGVDDLVALIRAFAAPGPPAACVPVHDGRQGNPVLWSGRWFPELRSLSGDRGAKSLLDEIEGSIVWVETGAGVLFDADTPEAMDLLERQEGP